MKSVETSYSDKSGINRFKSKKKDCSHHSYSRLFAKGWAVNAFFFLHQTRLQCPNVHSYHCSGITTAESGAQTNYFFHRYTTKVKSNRDQVRDPRQFSVSKKQAMCWPAWTPLPSWGRWMMHARLAAKLLWCTDRKSLPVIFCLHKGHVRFSISQESTHLQWNSCAHGKMRTLWGREKDQYQMDHWRGRIVIITRLN